MSANEFYGFAKLENGDVINISELNTDNRRSFGVFKCIGCERELTPALGKVIAHHFKHKKDANSSLNTVCNYETYIHKLAKNVVADAFNNAVRNNRPFNLVRRQDAVCTQNSHINGFDCKRKAKLKTHDLTKWFEKAEVEKGVDGFIADVLLSGKRGEMLIEIKVTHPCSEEKINSGLRIVEIEVTDEKEVKELRKGIVSARANAKEYNLKKEATISVNKCPTRCNRSHYALIAYKSGKHIAKKMSQYDINKRFHSDKFAKIKVYEDNDDLPEIIWDNANDIQTVTTRDRAGLVAFAEFALDFELKNCFNCKHSALLQDNHNIYGVSHNRFFCEHHNKGFVDYYTSEMCKSYTRDDPLSVAARFGMQLVQREE